MVDDKQKNVCANGFLSLVFTYGSLMEGGHEKNSTVKCACFKDLADMGHGDTVCLCDAGLPVPRGIEKIDLAVTAGVPGVVDVLLPVFEELFVERAIVSSELKEVQPKLFGQLSDLIRALEKSQGNAIPFETITHEDFKLAAGDCRAVIRTGECTPYANIILCSGVPF